MKFSYVFLFLISATILSCKNRLELEPVVFKNALGTITDPIFEKILIDLGIDKDKTVNGKMNPNDALSTIELRLADKKISSLDGIEMFTNLKKLNCSFNRLIELDLRNNKELEELYCSSGYISFYRGSGVLTKYSDVKMQKLDVSMCSKIKYIICIAGEISDLDISKMTDLRSLECTANKINTLDLSKASKINTLDCGYNNIKEINISNCKSLTYAGTYNNGLASINFDGLTELREVDVFSNKLSTIDISTNNKLTTLDCGSNSIKNLNFIFNLNLKTLNCNSCSTEIINLSSLPNLELIEFKSNNIKEISFANNKKISYVTLHYCKNLSSINVSQNTELKSLNCQYTSLKRLDLRPVKYLELLATGGTENLEICVNDVSAAYGNVDWFIDKSSYYSRCN